MLRKWKLLAAAVVMTVSMIMPSVAVCAATVSQETIEVPGGEKRHTVVAYGKSIAIVYPDGRTEIIANNPSGRIDVMIDGKVTKGIGMVIIPAQNGTNMVLEEGSFIVNGITDEQAGALKNMVVQSLTADTPVASASAIEGGEGMQGARAFAIDAKGGLLASDGSAAPASVLPEMQVKTPEVVYQAFSEAIEEGIRAQEEAEQKAREEEAAAGRDDEDTVVSDEESSCNGVTGMCVHEWEPYDLDVDVIILDNKTKCATGPFSKCTKCGTVMWLTENMHTHGEEHCQYCGYDMYGNYLSQECAGGGQHTLEDIVFPDDNPLVAGDYTYCKTGLVHECTKCNVIDTKDAITHEHGEDYCEYCGYNIRGERAEGTPLG